MKKQACSKCGSTNILSTKKMQRTCGPKNKPINRFCRISYGRVYYEHVCGCGHTWEEETHL
jgi:hypothetical protein